MGFRLLWSCSALLVILVTYNCPVSSQLVASQCIHNKEDFHTNNWIDYFSVLNWAQSGDDLPPDFVGKLAGQQEDVFYFDLAHANNGNPFLQNDFSWAGDATHAYIYIRYYAHSENPDIEFYVVPDVAGAFFFMQPAVDFEWKEAFIETVPSSLVEIGVFVSDFSTDSYFFIDTIMFLQGNDRLYIEDARAICPPREPEKTSLATDSTTDSPTDSGETSDTMAPTTITTASTPDSTLSSTANHISTPSSSDPALECINYSNDFSSHNWQSYPFHDYSEDSTGLPAELQGKLSAGGVFYLEGSLSFESKTFFKDYHEASDWGVVPTYLYLKYYAFITNNASQALYVLPAHVPSGDHTVNLPLGSGYSWEETIVQIDGTIEDMKIVEFGIRDFQAGEYLLVDKIGVARANSYVEVLDLVGLCAGR